MLIWGLSVALHFGDASGLPLAVPARKSVFQFGAASLLQRLSLEYATAFNFPQAIPP